MEQMKAPHHYVGLITSGQNQLGTGVVIHIDDFDLTVLTAFHNVVDPKTLELRSELRFNCGHHGDQGNSFWRGRIEMIKFPDRASKKIDNDLYDGLNSSSIFSNDDEIMNSKFDFALARVKIMRN